MELVSIGYIQNTAILQYGKYGHLKELITNFFSNFLEKYSEWDYVWYESRLYVAGEHLPTIKKNLEDLLNKQINGLRPKSFPEEYNFRFIDSVSAKKRIDRRIQKKKLEREKKRNKIIHRFEEVVGGIKSHEQNHRFIGSFDLEFWEQDMSILLEFGWRIEDYHTGEGKTTHLIVKDNLNRKNGFYSKNNRFSRSDSKVVSLATAKQIFHDEFLSKVEVLVGHGLSNDYKALGLNGIDVRLPFLDTSDIGPALMDRDDKISLEKLLNHLKIQHDDLHNAANDVEFILKAFYEMGKLG